MKERDERGSALAVVLFATTALAALGIGILVVGELETSSARHGITARQAARAAESGLNLVKHWFDAPAGCAGEWLVPAASETDRSRRRVDPDGDGSYQSYATAPAPWNVVYRGGSDDLFERPYRGLPALALEGDARGPDLLIDEDSTDPNVRAFLSRLNTALFPAPPGPNLVLRIRRISIYAPPRIGSGATRVRLGIATIEIVAGVYRVSPGGDSGLASARASGVLQEIPYAAPGPLTVGGSIEDGTGLDLRWGPVLVSGGASFGADPTAGLPWGWPWRALETRLVRDANGDGTADDSDADGLADLDEWLGLPDTGLADPWFQLLVGAAIAGAPAGAQPYPFDPARIPGPYTTAADRSALFQNVAGPGAFAVDAPVYRAAAGDGGPSTHLFVYVPGSSPPLFREGNGPVMDFETATRGGGGLFFFDTADGRPPRDTDGDGVFDNLTPPINVAARDWYASGVLIVNARSISLPASARAGSAAIGPPGEPFADLDGDGTCGAGEPYLQLDYPPDPLAPGAAFARLGLATVGGGPPRRARGPVGSAGVSFAGLLLTTGRFAGGEGARIFGAVVAAGSVSASGGAGVEPIQILYDTRMREDGWPPSDSRLPRTFWQGREVYP